MKFGRLWKHASWVLVASAAVGTGVSAQVYQPAPAPQPAGQPGGSPGVLPGPAPTTASRGNPFLRRPPVAAPAPVMLAAGAEQPGPQPSAVPAGGPAAQPSSGVVPAQYQEGFSGLTGQAAVGQQQIPESLTSAPVVRELTSPIPPGTLSAQAAGPGEHPLMPAIRWAREGLPRLEQIQDYSCTLVKREQINGVVGEHQYMFVKVRHKPFSVYMYFLGPPSMKGQEALYVEGQNNGNLQAHANGVRHKLFGTVSLRPDSMLAMHGNRYPITEVGFLNLTRKLIVVGEEDMKFGEIEVKFLEGAKINGRDCTCIQVMHPVRRREFKFYLARIYVDTELNLPIRYEAYDWPTGPNQEPLLQEEYTYLNLKLNQGFTDMDFDVRNPNYQFQ